MRGDVSRIQRFSLAQNVIDAAFGGERLASSGQNPVSRASPRPASSRPGERLLGKRILVAEDEALVALELQQALESEGADVLGPAESLLKALETVTHAAEIDAAVLDIDLAGEDVYPIAELLLQRGVPFVFYTGYGSRSDLRMLFPDTVTLTKPTPVETVIEHLLRLSP